ncbi:hypothetical protein F4778DRAFT_767076 [Xylariomycetidae sp. FL2044]|nr:hypothetical protein F4778DRAFT_767076 [Xylariomycetidae sp. FL2044]
MAHDSRHHRSQSDTMIKSSPARASPRSATVTTRPTPCQSCSRRAPATISSSRPFAFPPLDRPNPSHTSLAQSPIEARPIRLHDSTAPHRTTALRELKSITTTTTETYSQPVLVRTYSGPLAASATTGSRTRASGRRISRSTAGSTCLHVQDWRSNRHDNVLNMPRARGKERARPEDRAKLPPLEAFSFRGILADIRHDITPDLEHISEIYASASYSLSDQYDVHMAPHGSGTTFLAPPASSSKPQLPVGPTLQAIPGDEEQAGAAHKNRASQVRRRSVAYGTLETIMSSSRSSEDDKTKRKSAAEIADKVRGRMAPDRDENETGSANDTELQASSDHHYQHRTTSHTGSTLIRSNSNITATTPINNGGQGTKRASVGLLRTPPLTKIFSPLSPAIILNEVASAIIISPKKI